MNSSISPEWLHASQVPEMFGLTPGQAHSLADEGKIERRTIQLPNGGETRLFRVESIREYIEGHANDAR